MNLEELIRVYTKILATHPTLRIDPADYDFFVFQRSGYKPFDFSGNDYREMLKTVCANLSESEVLSLYIHYPFCRDICEFCHYAVFGVTEPYISNLMKSYINLLIQEIELLNEHLGGLLKGKKLSSLYLGGGTPGLMPNDELTKLFDFLHNYFDFGMVTESTIETLPEIITEKRVYYWQKFFNRISIGIQSLNPSLLKKIGRKAAKNKISDPSEVLRSLEILNQAISNHNWRVNFDLIYGIPGQTLEHIQADVSEIIARVTCPMLSFTLYRLRLHRGDAYSALYSKYQSGELELPPQEYTYALGFLASRYLESLGFQEGPVGWFMKGYSLECYKDRWQEQVPLIGVGLSSYSYVGKYEWKNWKSFHEYITAINNKMLPWSKYCILDPVTPMMRRFKYRMFLDRIEAEYLQRIFPEISNILKDERIFMRSGDGKYVLTRIGIPMIEEIIN